MMLLDVVCCRWFALFFVFWIDRSAGTGEYICEYLESDRVDDVGHPLSCRGQDGTFPRSNGLDPWHLHRPNS